jgi:hypothetical protein
MTVVESEELLPGDLYCVPQQYPIKSMLIMLNCAQGSSRIIVHITRVQSNGVHVDIPYTIDSKWKLLHSSKEVIIEEA